MQQEMIKKVIGEYTLGISKDGKRLQYFGKQENILSGNDLPPIFRLRFLNDDGSFSLYTADDANEIVIRDEKDRLELEFSGFDIPMSIVLAVRADTAESFFRWSVDIKSEKQLEYVEYPCVKLKDRFKGKGSAQILYPYNEGVLTNDIDLHWYIEPEYPSMGCFGMYPGMVFAPFMACVDEEAGLYFASHNAKDTRQVDYYRDGDGIRLQMRLYPGVHGGNYQSDEETVFCGTEGDWFAFAEIYRRQFEKNKDGRFVKIEQNSNLPDWYKKSPVVLTYCVRGKHDLDELNESKLYPHENALPVIDEYAKDLNSSIMVVLMHWEGTAPWAPPYVWPPYGGEKPLSDFIEKMHTRGNAVGVYCSGLGWTQKSNLCDYSREKEFEEKGLARFMNIAPDGSLPLSQICTGQRSGYDLCISQDFTKDTMKSEVEKMASIGLDYIQLMDQNHGGTPYMCYSRTHGHPPAPGKWQSEEMNALLEEMLSKHKKLLLGCESSAAETFIPNLLFSDNRYGLNYKFGIPVPLYAYLYHEYLNNFMGNNVCGDMIFDCRQDRSSFAYRVAYSFIAGDLLTIVINDEGKMQWAWIQKDFSDAYMPEQKNNKEFIRCLNRWRQVYPKFLQTGKMLAVPKYDCKKHALKIETGDRETETVLSVVYQSSDGETAQFFVNWTEEEQPICFEKAQKGILLNQPNSTGEVFEGNSLCVPARSVLMLK